MKVWLLYDHTDYDRNYVIAVFDHEPSEEEKIPFCPNPTNGYGYSIDEMEVISVPRLHRG
jgi:hypothetical protein